MREMDNVSTTLANVHSCTLINTSNMYENAHIQTRETSLEDENKKIPFQECSLA